MKVGKNTVSSCKPSDFNMKDNGDGYDIAVNTDITRQQVVDEESGELVYVYKYVRYAATTALKSYDEAVAALVHLKYSLDDEVALLKKGMADFENEEYVAYLAYVEGCKEYARTIFNK